MRRDEKAHHSRTVRVVGVGVIATGIDHVMGEKRLVGHTEIQKTNHRLRIEIMVLRQGR